MDYENEVSNAMQKHIDANYLISTDSLKKVINNKPGNYCLVVLNRDKSVMLHFTMFNTTSGLIGFIKLPTNGAIPGPSIVGFCATTDNSVAIFDIASRRIATISQLEERLICGVTSMCYIRGINDIFAETDDELIKLTAIKLTDKKITVCLTTPRKKCNECLSFNAFEIDFTEHRITPEAAVKNTLNNIPVSINTVTYICDKGTVTNIMGEIKCKHVKKCWSFPTTAKFVDSFGPIVLFKQNGSYMMYNGEQHILSFAAEHALFDGGGSIWLRAKNIVYHVGLTKKYELEIFNTYANCDKLTKIGRSASITSGKTCRIMSSNIGNFNGFFQN